jgi:hypothetical protein
VAYSHDLRWLTLSKESLRKLEVFGYVLTEMPANSFKGQTQPVLLPGTDTAVNRQRGDTRPDGLPDNQGAPQEP